MSNGQYDDIIKHPAIAAALGAFVSLALARKMTILQALLSWMAGWSCAVYLAPALMLWSPTLAQSEPGTAFLVGAFGLQIVAIFYDICVVLREDPKATLGMVIDVLQRKKGNDK